MRKPMRAMSIAVAGLTATALAFPWIAQSAPNIPLPLIVDGPVTSAPPKVVNLDFAEPSRPVQLPPANGEADLTPTVPQILEPAKIPAEIPGASVVFPVPKRDPANPKAFEEAISKMYPPLPPIGVVMPPQMGPEGRPITLEDLQRIAETSSPLIRSVANSDHELAAIEAEVIAGVRHGYFAVLAAQESMRVQEAFATFAENALRVHVERAIRGQADAAEPLALRALTFKARAELVQARNRYLGAWKQLAATTGKLDLQPSLLDGRIDRPLPVIEFEAAHSYVLSRNSEMAAAQRGVEAAHSAARRNSQMPFQIFNQANSNRTRIDLAKAKEEPDRVRARLTSQLTEAFEKYDNQRRVLAYYRDDIIPDRVRNYRAIAARAAQTPDRSNHAEVVAAQHELATSVSTYLQTLGDAWFAVVDIARLMQSRDLFAAGDATSGNLPLSLAQLPSCQVGTAVMHWPAVMPSLDEPPVRGDIRKASMIAGNTSAAATSPACLTTCLPPDSVLEGTAPGRIAPQPVSESMMVAPYASVEKSTKRRKFFWWPIRRDIELPSVLPVSDSAACCPPSVDSILPAVSKPAVQTRPEFEPPIKLPEIPAKALDPAAVRSTMTAPPPLIFEGPALTPQGETPSTIVPVVSNTDVKGISTIPSEIQAALDATPVTTSPRPNIAKLARAAQTPLSGPGQISAATLTATKSMPPRNRPQPNVANLTLPQASPAPMVAVPPLRLPSLD